MAEKLYSVQYSDLHNSLYLCVQCGALPIPEPDLGMEPGLAHHFFKQLLSGVVCREHLTRLVCIHVHVHVSLSTFVRAVCLCSSLGALGRTHTGVPP